MKKSVIALYLGLVIHFTSIAQNAGAQKSIIGFYNVENLFDTLDDPNTIDEEFLPEGKNQWTNERYSIKLQNIGKVIASIKPDILGLGEIENRKVLEDLVTQPALASGRYQIIHVDMHDERGVDVALLYRPAVFKPFVINQLVIKDPAEPEFKTRNILWVKGLFMGDTLHIAVNHWPSRLGGKEDKRILAATVLKRAVDSVTAINPQANIVMVGDFNDDPNNKSIKKVLIADSENIINVAEPTFKKGYGTLGYNGVWNLFDQILISGSLTDKNGIDYMPDSFGIFAQRWMIEPTGKYKGMPMRSFRGGVFNDAGYSDHFPVFVILQKN